MNRWSILLSLAFVSELHATPLLACPSVGSALATVLARDGFTGAVDADLRWMAKTRDYCLYRYEYVFGRAGRMASRLVVLHRGRYIGSYAVSFADARAHVDSVVLTLSSGSRHVMPVTDLGSRILVDGEMLTFYK